MIVAFLVISACGETPQAKQSGNGATESLPDAPQGTTGASACPDSSVKNPGAVAVQPTNGSVCWSARPGSNFVPLALDGTTLIAAEGKCPQGDGGWLVGLDARTGRELWSTAASLTNESPAALAGVMVANDQERQRLAGIDTGAGKRLWSRRGEVFAVADTADVVAIVVPGRRLLVLDRRTGNQVWETAIKDEYAAVAADGDMILVSGEAATTAYDASTGVKQWDAPVVPASDTSALRVTARVATGSAAAGNAAVGYNLATGKLLWRNAAMPAQDPDPRDGNVFVQGEDGAVTVLDARTGRARWAINPASNEYVQLEAGPGMVVSFSGDPFTTGKTEGHDPVTGSVQWNVKTVKGLPRLDTVLPGGFSPGFTGMLPSADLVYIGYGNCLSD